MSSLKFWFEPAERVELPEAVFFDAHAEHGPLEVHGNPRRPRQHRPRWTIVEASREDEVALRESWETGEPVEIAGVQFEMAVIARQRTWWRPALVRGRTSG